ncbi:transposase [Saprospira grandis]|nr:transposase [Saprospira grandis]
MARKTKAPLWQIVKAIIYRLKTGCQWRELPIQSFFVRKF